MKKILLNISQGIGNILQTTQTIAGLVELGFTVDILYLTDGLTPDYVVNLINDRKYVRNFYFNPHDVEQKYSHYAVCFGPSNIMAITAENATTIDVNKSKPDITSITEVEINFNICRELGYDGDIPSGYFVVMPPTENYRYSDLIVFGPGGKMNLFGQRKKYREYDEVVRYLGADNILFVGNTNDYNYHEELHKFKWFVGDGVNGLLQAAGIVANARLFIGNDSAFSHLRAITQKPQITIFGPSAIAKNRPYNKNNFSVETEVECLPCQLTGGWRTCDGDCMDFDPIYISNLIEEILNRINFGG